MTRWTRRLVGVLLAVAAIAPITLHADTVQLSVRDGRLSLVATNATPKQIFEAWSRAGGVMVVNAERMPAVPITITLENVPEEQALETLLRSVSGYLARRRVEGSAAASVFDRIVILPTPASAAPAAVVAAPPAGAAPGRAAVFPQPARPTFVPPPPPAAAPPAAAPAGIPQGPGVTRLVGPDGQPVEDDQAGAPPPVFNGGDPPDARAPVGTSRPGQQPPPPTSSQPQQPAPAPAPATGAPAGSPRPGMVVPAPQPQQQLR